jgi:hypothetical protein
MSKTTIGVGEEFPVGDGEAEDDRSEFEEWRRRRAEWRARREEWHGHRNGGYRHWHGRGAGPAFLMLAVPLLGLVTLFALASAAFHAPFVMLALVGLMMALLFWRHHGHHHGYRGRYAYCGRYRRDEDAEPREPSRDAPQAGA